MNTFGNTIRITFSGASHAPAIRLVVEGLPAGIRIDEPRIRAGLDRRRPQSALSTARRESDRFIVDGGLAEGVTDGSPLVYVIPNEDVRPEAYAAFRHTPRPGHADYPAYVKSGGTADLSGGGMYSGRMTALFMIAGAIAEQVLNGHGIVVGSHLLALGGVVDRPFDPVDVESDRLRTLAAATFPVIDPDAGAAMEKAILAAKERHDSIGGVIETAVVGLPAGTGEPLFLSLESQLSSLLFAIPAIKGIEFGDGFGFASRFGSEVKDEYRIAADGSVRTAANHNGGILGGMATGMPVILRTVVKPTASIGLPQRSVDLAAQAEVEIVVGGRHDPAIVHRAVHVVNAAVYFALFDLMAKDRPAEWFR